MFKTTTSTKDITLILLLNVLAGFFIVTDLIIGDTGGNSFLVVVPASILLIGFIYGRTSKRSLQDTSINFKVMYVGVLLVCIFDILLKAILFLVAPTLMVVITYGVLLASSSTFFDSIFLPVFFISFCISVSFLIVTLIDLIFKKLSYSAMKYLFWIVIVNLLVSIILYLIIIIMIAITFAGA